MVDDRFCFCSLGRRKSVACLWGIYSEKVANVRRRMPVSVELLLSLDSTLLSCLVRTSHLTSTPEPTTFFISVFHARSSRPIQSNAVTHPPTQPGFGCARGASTTHLPKHKTNRSTERHRSRVGLLALPVRSIVSFVFHKDQSHVAPLGLGASSHSVAPHLPHTFAPHFPRMRKGWEILASILPMTSLSERPTWKEAKGRFRERRSEAHRDRPPRRPTRLRDTNTAAPRAVPKDATLAPV